MSRSAQFCFLSRLIECVLAVAEHAIFSLTTKFIQLKVSNIAIAYEPVHGISNNVVCATSKASDQPAHTRSLIRAFASRLSIL